MPQWRFVSDDEDQELRDNPQEAVVTFESPPLEMSNIYEVVSGHVCPYVGGMTQDISKIVPPGWYAALIDNEIPGCTYEAGGLLVKMYDNEVELKNGTLVVLFPPDHLEKARELPAPVTD